MSQPICLSGSSFVQGMYGTSMIMKVNKAEVFFEVIVLIVIIDRGNNIQHKLGAQRGCLKITFLGKAL
jgi:hypothetical protein